MLKIYRERYRAELLDSIVPFWLKHSPDTDFGGFYSCLDREGNVFDTRKYIWLQGRFVWTFSRLYNEVEQKPEWLAVARSGAEFLQRHAWDPGGRCYFSLSREGRPVYFQRKPYGAVFVMLGLLEYARATGEKSFQETAIDLFWRIHAWIEYPGMLGRPLLEGEAPGSKLADVMVLSMMAQALYDAVGDRRYHQLMMDCIDTALRHAEPRHNILMENVAPNGAKRFELPEGRLFNPGHSIETAWVLLHLLEYQPDKERRRQVLDLLEGSLEFGWDSEFGGLFAFRDVEGKPPLPIQWQMKLWWPHSEAIYAVILAYTITRESRWLDWLERLDEYTFTHFRDQEYGAWFGYCDRRGNLTSTLKGDNYKGMYHEARALLFSIQRIARFEHSRTTLDKTIGETAS